MTRSVATARLVCARVRQSQALWLRASGHSYQSIATHLGYRSRTAAYRAVRRGMEATRNQAAIAYRVLLFIRFERLDETLAMLIQTGQVGEAKRIMEDSIIQAELDGWTHRRWHSSSTGI